ncbi:helix-turn-helix domain-containing protein [Micromonospora carbonacea]|uniref:Helix-turn-helix transcriptional regulator n=2 Tax=Micromonospora carbonacea TaxID=47853 RepID=A0A7H8XJ45_9ACTN|nr:helix-turn-helix transcriptional regulator [Micromonospora carbonacea]MBB5827715.1 transcriptional regulator with XRE-family HTH domain [Micromonospora carbonacea]QLD24558.1 helix-turn-helix transcriptional regulator [Micromonospora carbonacea]
MTNRELPIGRRVARLRTRRRMTQQMLADRLGKSKSWVDKVERGVRALDRYTVIQELAAALRVDPVALLGRDALPSQAARAAAHGIDGVRAALDRYDTALTGPQAQRAAPPVGELDQRVRHAWLTYQHADYPQLLRILPELLGDTRHAHAAQGDGAAEPLVQAYRVTSAVLVKLGVGDLGWLAADRAVSVAAGDPLLVAAAAVPLGQALRALGRPRPALAVTVAAAHRIAPEAWRGGPPPDLALHGTLLVQAALAAAGAGDERGAAELVDQAARVADETGESGETGGERDRHWTGFGPTAVRMARVAAAVELGNGGEAVLLHERVVGAEHWRRLPAEHRAAYLLDAGRAHLGAGDPLAAGRALVDADRTAPAEVRLRPVARTLLTDLTCHEPLPADVARLATALGVG